MHIDTVCPCGRVHDAAERFYVTLLDDSRPQRVAYLAGPFATHPEALERVESARRIAENSDPRAVFYSTGTTGVRDDGALPPGRLNTVLGVQ